MSDEKYLPSSYSRCVFMWHISDSFINKHLKYSSQTNKIFSYIPYFYFTVHNSQLYQLNNIWSILLLKLIFANLATDTEGPVSGVVCTIFRQIKTNFISDQILNLCRKFHALQIIQTKIYLFNLKIFLFILFIKIYLECFNLILV